MFLKKLKHMIFTFLFFCFVSHNNKNDFSHILILCLTKILFFMMYNIGLNIGPNILLFITHYI